MKAAGRENLGWRDARRTGPETAGTDWLSPERAWESHTQKASRTRTAGPWAPTERWGARHGATEGCLDIAMR